ncbi:type II toxin-antitoxin system CcdA family antitoxin [Caenimonas koreensis]|uniref:type II toxin-antitoxin system CcdA family antitoxin n=1 Tax=Caenimonas koreensis TaxID=367474 RepID=UPI00378312D5
MPLPPSVTSTRKRPVNLTLNEHLVAEAKSYTTNLSATIESVNDAVGSFADEHSTL